MRVVVPQKTTYLHAEAVDGGPIDVPPQVLEEVRPTAPGGIGDQTSPSVVVRFAIDTEGRIGEIEISRATDDRLTAPAIETFGHLADGAEKGLGRIDGACLRAEQQAAAGCDGLEDLHERSPF